MSRFILVRKLFALAALMLLLATAPAVAQSDSGFIEAPLPTDLELDARSPRLAQAPEDLLPEDIPPETLDAGDAIAIEEAEVEVEEPEIDYTLDESTVQKSVVQKGGGCCDSCGCDDCCDRGCDLFGCLRRMMETCASHKQARCNGCYKGCQGKGCHGKGCHGKGCQGKGCHGKSCHGKGCRGKGCHGNRRLDHSMTCQKGQRHDPNRPTHASGQLFRQYYAQSNCGGLAGQGGGIAAQLYVAPYPVPAAVGHTYITYQAFEPSQFMYRHKRHYVRRHGPSGGTTSTRIYWW